MVRLQELAEVARVRVGLTAAAREEAIAELLSLLVHEGQLTPSVRDLAQDAVLAREVVQSTGMTHGVALPHSPIAGLTDVVVAIGTRPQGVTWPCQDGTVASIIILVLVPENHFQVHVRTLSALARLLNDSSLRERIAMAESEAVLLSVLAEVGAS